MGSALKQFTILLVGLSFMMSPITARGQPRIKDITSSQGVRDNVLVGYGLVVGLNGTGDDVKSNPYTQVSLASMLERLGVRVDTKSISTKSVAAVIVTANLPPFSRNGTRIDIEISTVGNAKSLLGGTLLVTPLMAADGDVYAVAQGPLTVGGFAAGGKAERVTKGVPTGARIANGAIIEREVAFDLNKMREIHLQLNNPDFTTARRIATALNREFILPVAFPVNSATVRVKVPKQFYGKIVDFMTKMEQIRVEPDQSAKVVINEASGVIVMGSEVKVSKVAIAQANLIVEIQENDQVSQPGAFTNVDAATVTPETTIQIDDNSDARMRVLEQTTSLRQLVNGLNALGVGPRDLMSILQSIKAAGALQAELQVI